ncbi:response regulator [Variovorax sp. MHTC-1]|uniref:response regulator n=1 Tax=Variovorax sp. MHTC-1 TaxID=2495593 RepID=UPI000F861BD0|nr:response regulator [Variovorax sp. MHTC-1]RST50112.1 response regulator [Variovorax sp. MHTC-1]
MSTKTFLVEDSATIRANLVPAMRELADVEVIACVETESEAVAWLATYTGDLHLAVVDLLLREGSGLGVTRHFRRARSQLAIVVLTNYATTSTRGRAMAAGASAVFDKSTELEEFFAYCAALSR